MGPDYRLKLFLVNAKTAINVFLMDFLQLYMMCSVNNYSNDLVSVGNYSK